LDETVAQYDAVTNVIKPLHSVWNSLPLNLRTDYNSVALKLT